MSQLRSKLLRHKHLKIDPIALTLVPGHSYLPSRQIRVILVRSAICHDLLLNSCFFAEPSVHCRRRLLIKRESDERSLSYSCEQCDLCGKCLEFCPYVDYDLERAQKEIHELVAGGTPPIPGLCVTCASCNLICPTKANPFDLLNQRQEETGALGIPEQAVQNFEKLHRLPTVVKRGQEGKPIMNLCIVGDMVRDLLDHPLFEGLTLVEGADYSVPWAISTWGNRVS